MKPVESSNISHLGWDDGTLKVRFKNGTEYHFSNVPLEAHDKLVGAESVGKHFTAHIRGKFAHKKQDDKK